MTNKYASRINQNLFLMILFFFVVLLTVFLGISNSYYKNKQIEFYQISLDELSRTISFDLKLNNLFNIKKELAGSYVARVSDKILVRDETNEVTFHFPDNISKDACDGDMLESKITYDGQTIGVIESCYTLEVFQGYLPIFIFTGLISLIVFFIVRVWFSVNTSGLMGLMSELDSLDLDDVVKKQKLLKVKDENLAPVINKLNDLLLKMKDLYVHEEHGRIVRQLKHDIRSPILVLSTIIDDSKGLAANERHILSTAVQRISKILTDLNKNVSIPETKITSNDAVFLEYALANLISDKKLEYQDRENLRIEFKPLTREISYIKTDEPFFYRALSNLINNAVEAIGEGRGDVTISLSETTKEAIIEIEDNGPGIPKDKLLKVFEAGYTTKASGTGLGLPQVKSFVENTAGTIDLSEGIYQGTKVVIRFPVLLHKSIVQELPVTKKKVIIVDDDVSIHKLWKTKLDNAGLAQDYYLNTTSIPLLDDQAVWIIDHDLGSGKMKGLDFIIKSFSSKENIYLSSNNISEIALLDACETYGVKIIPKFILPSLEVKILK